MIYNSKQMDKDHLCKRRRSLNLHVSSGDKPEFKRSRITREAVMKYKKEGFTFDQTIRYIREQMKDVPCVSETTRDVQTEEAILVVSRYLLYDDRRMTKVYPEQTFVFEGETISVQPDLIYTYVDPDDMLFTAEVIHFSSGRQKYVTGTRGDKTYTSLQYNLIGLGLYLYGKSLLPDGTGKVIIVSDALKTDTDRKGIYEPEWKTSGFTAKGTKGSNRNQFAVTFDHGVPKVHYEENYKDSLKEFLEGCEPEACKKATCDTCEYSDLCHYNHRPVSKDQKVIDKKQIANLSVSEEQQKIVDFKEGICVANAGAGSGKSHTIAVRIAKLLREGTKPEKIALISFSRTAVAVLVDRVKKILDAYDLDIDVGKIKIASFNSMGSEIIAKYYRELGFTKEPELVDSVSEYEMVLASIDWDHPILGLDYKNPHMDMNVNVVGAAKYIHRQIRIIRDRGMNREAYKKYVEDEMNPEDGDFVNKIYNTAKRFADNMRDHNLIDYSDQNNLVLTLMSEDQKYVTSIFQYEHIVVDEFQDSNDFQIFFLRYLIETAWFKSLLVVGDASQAIYSFRGTSPDNILNFEEKIGDEVEDLYLTTNYRSVRTIVNESDELLDTCGLKHKKMKSGRTDAAGNHSFLISFRSKDEEVEEVADLIQDKIEGCGVRPEEIAVIAARRGFLNSVSKALSERNILSQFDMPERILDDSRVKAGLGILEFIADQSNTKGLMLYLNELHQNRFLEMTSCDVRRIIELDKESFKTVDYVGLTEEEKLNFVKNLLFAIEDGSDHIYTSFIHNLSAKATAGQIIDYGIKLRLYGLDDTGEKEGEFEAVSLVTAHSSKGKEWKLVYLSVTDFDSDKESREDVIEKARLAYVGMTRARDYLTITTSYKKSRYNRVSFIMENMPSLTHFTFDSFTRKVI